MKEKGEEKREARKNKNPSLPLVNDTDRLYSVQRSLETHFLIPTKGSPPVITNPPTKKTKKSALASRDQKMASADLALCVWLVSSAIVHT